MNNQPNPVFRRALLADMAAFVRHPRAYQGDEAAFGAGQRVLRTLRVWALLFTTLLPFMCLIVFLLMAFAAVSQRMMSGGLPGAVDPNDPLGGFDSQNAITELIAKGNPLLVFFLAVIQAPILEEMGFRLGLKPTRRSLSIGLGAFFYFAISFVLNLFGKPRSATSAVVSLQATAFNLAIAVGAITVLALLLSLVFRGGRLAWVQHFYARHFWLPYAASSIIFGLIHITNYTNPVLWLAAPILVFPQLLLGFGLGYVRVRFGFVPGVLMHMLHNGLLMVPSLISMQMPRAAGAASNTAGVMVGAFFSAYCGLIVMLMLLNLVWSIAELRRPKTV